MAERIQAQNSGAGPDESAAGASQSGHKPHCAKRIMDDMNLPCTCSASQSAEDVVSQFLCMKRDDTSAAPRFRLTGYELMTLVDMARATTNDSGAAKRSMDALRCMHCHQVVDYTGDNTLFHVYPPDQYNVTHAPQLSFLSDEDGEKKHPLSCAVWKHNGAVRCDCGAAASQPASRKFITHCDTCGGYYTHLTTCPVKIAEDNAALVEQLHQIDNEWHCTKHGVGGFTDSTMRRHLADSHGVEYADIAPADSDDTAPQAHHDQTREAMPPDMPQDMPADIKEDPIIHRGSCIVVGGREPCTCTKTLRVHMTTRDINDDIIEAITDPSMYVGTIPRVPLDYRSAVIPATAMVCPICGCMVLDTSLHNDVHAHRKQR